MTPRYTVRARISYEVLDELGVCDTSFDTETEAVAYAAARNKAEAELPALLEDLRKNAWWNRHKPPFNESPES